MVVPSYVLHFEPSDDGTFGVRLAAAEPGGPRQTVAAGAGYRLPAGWAAACNSARCTPASPPEAFLALRFDLWTNLPDAVKSALEAALAGAARLVVCAGGDAAAVPWEVLTTEADWREHGSQTTRALAPALRGQWSLSRRPPGVERAAVPGEPTRHALLLIGSLRTPPDAFDPHQQVARIALAMRRAGFTVVIAAGRQLDAAAAPRGLDVNEWLDDAQRVPRLLRGGRFTLFHYVGLSHEPAAPADLAAGVLPSGAQDLLLEIRGAEQPLAAQDLADALVAGGVRCAVLSACDLREAFAAKLLTAGAGADAPPCTLEHVLTMGARVPIAVCAEWSQGFYEALRDQPSVTAAVAAGTARLRLSDTGKRHAWLPQHWSATDVDLTFADDERVLLERACARTLDLLDAFEGRFRRRLDPARLSDVYVELYVDPRQDRDKARPGEVLDPRDAALVGAEAKFDDLLRLPHTRAILLGGAPGAGKSTTLRMASRKLAENPLRAHLPIFVSLADWLPSPSGAPVHYVDLLDYAVRKLRIRDAESGVLSAALARLGDGGGLAFFLDGLDELSPKARDFLDEQLMKLRRDFAACRFVVSARRYEHSVQLRGCVVFDIRPLTPRRGAELLEKVLRTRWPEAQAHRVAHDDWLPRFARGARTWLDLGKVPLFVTLIGELLLHGRQPGESRVEFFAEVFAHLCLDQHHGGDLEPDDRDQGPRPLIADPPGDPGDPAQRHARVGAVLDVLAHLALQMTERAQLTATRAELVAWLREGSPAVAATLELASVATDKLKGTDPGAFLDAVARRTLILAPDVSVAAESGDQLVWRFWHRSFQEALTARRLFVDLSSNPASTRSLMRMVLALVRRLLGRRRRRESVTHVVARMRLTPTNDEVEAARVGLLKKWSADEETFSADYGEWYVQASAKDVNAVEREHRNPDRTFKPSVLEAVAALWAAETAKRALLDFWVEPSALLLALAVPSGAAHASSGVVGIDEVLCRALIKADAGLGRAAVASLDRCPVPLFEQALAATTRSDAAVAQAKTGTDLYEGLTLRLTERLPLYVGAAAATTDAARLVVALRQRIAAADDPGELFLIDEALAALKHGKGMADARAALRARFGTPSSATYRAHFVPVAGGEFWRGSGESAGEPRERPARLVRVSPFAIGRTAVTVAMYREFFAEHRMAVGTELMRLRDWRGEVEGEPVDAFPVTYVSWWAAQMFCRWLGWHRALLPDGLPGQPSLPTETEREFAARAGSARAYSFGDDAPDLDAHGWHRGNSEGRPHAVGRRLANPLGLLDMHGGVWEWCLDAYRAYAAGGDVLVDPLVFGPSASARVLRGGSFYDHPDGCRSAFRDGNRPANAVRGDGLRVVLAARPQLALAIEDRS